MNTTRLYHDNLKAFVDGKTTIINRGGTSSSKTFTILEILILLAHRRKYLISVVSETMPHLKRAALKDFMDIMKADDLYDEKLHNRTDNVFKFNEGSIEFFSCDSVIKVHGPRRDVLFIDECNNVPKEIYEQLNIRTKVCTFLSFNPTAPFWVCDIPRTDNVIEIVSTYKDNPFLGKKIVDEIEARKGDYQWFSVYGRGEWGSLEGAIFHNWDQCPEIPKDAKLLGFGLDFGFSADPTAVVEVRMMDGEIYLREVIYRSGLLNRDISKELEAVGVVRGIDEIWADCADPKSIAELRGAGWVIRGAKKGLDSVNNGINIMKHFKIHVTADSINLIKELRNYKWQSDKFTGKAIDKPEDEWNHAIDATRYLMSTKLNKKKRFLRQWN